MKRICAGVLAVMLAFCCATSLSAAEKEKISTPGSLEPQSTGKFSDLPIPAGFKFMPQESYTFETAGVRVGLLKYQGKANIEQLMVFLKEQMPLFNWYFLNSIEYGERLLNFDREGETCIIRIVPKGSKEAIIIFSIGPKAANPARKTERERALK